MTLKVGNNIDPGMGNNNGPESDLMGNNFGPRQMKK